MALRSLRLERFRGIRTAQITFEQTTVLIAENGCGVSSVLEALALALSPVRGDRPRIEPRHFHASRGVLRVELTFVESSAGSWDRSGLESLSAVLAPPRARPRTLALEISAELKGRNEVDTHWVIRSLGGGTARDDEPALAALRRINPFVWLRHGELLRPVVDGDGSDYEELLQGADKDLENWIQADAAAANRQLDEWAPMLRRKSGRIRATVSEILTERGHQSTPTAPPPARGTGGSAAQQLGIFLVAARVLDELRRSDTRGVRPIIVVDEPEAHLHPMTQAAVLALLETLDAQRIVTTQSGTLLAAAPLRSLRRLVRDSEGAVRERRVSRESMQADEVRKVAYHLRARRSVACFARTWLLVEGETEYWVLPDLARLCGYDFAQEGIVCVEFAQCGLVPLIKLANSLGISWHVLTDGDRAGTIYVRTAQPYLQTDEGPSRLTQMPDRDIEHCFWRHGYAPVFQQLANVPVGARIAPGRVIEKAIHRHSKPDVAFELLSAVAAKGIAGVPPLLRNAIETCVRLARGEGLPDPSARPRKNRRARNGSTRGVR